MSDQEKKQQSTNISSQLDVAKKKVLESTELSEEELKKISGGSGDPCEGGEVAGKIR